jgi:rod shape-determining protein MreC
MKVIKDFSINRRRNKITSFFIGAIALFFVLIILFFLSSGIKNIFLSVSYPLEKVFWSAGESSSSFFGSIFSSGNISKENQQLKNENQRLLSQVAYLQSIEQGNQAQSSISELCQNTGFKLLMAGVAGLDNNDILSINKGSADGVSVGMPVIGPQNALYGKIFKVYKNFSDIMLISNKNSAINVRVQQGQDNGPVSNSIYGIVKGSGGLSGFLDLVPITDNINSHDILVTSAMDNSFPKDLLVGEITEITKNDQKPFQQARVNLFSDFKTNNLFVITNYKQQ